MLERETFKVIINTEKVILIPNPETLNKIVGGFYYSPLNWINFYHLKIKNWNLETYHRKADNLFIASEISVDDMKERFVLTKIEDGKATFTKFDADNIPTKETIILESGIYSFALTTKEVITNGFCYKVTNS